MAKRPTTRRAPAALVRSAAPVTCYGGLLACRLCRHPIVGVLRKTDGGLELRSPVCGDLHDCATALARWVPLARALAGEAQEVAA